MERAIDGVKIKMGYEEYIIPPLTFRALRELQDDIDSLKDVGTIVTPEQATVMIRIIHRAVERNYPNTTKEQLEDLLDLGNLPKILKAILGVSGFVDEKKNQQITSQ